MNTDTADNLEPCWDMFELTYSAYMVLHRVALCAMPREWQSKFVALMAELEATVDVKKMPSSFLVKARENGKFVHDPYSDYRHGRAPMKDSP